MMKIKDVKDSKNKEFLKKKIKSIKNELLFGRLIVCIGGPSWLAVLGLSIQDTDKNNILMAIFVLGIMIAMHYQNQDRRHELYSMEEQLSQIEEEQEDTEVLTRILSK